MERSGAQTMHKMQGSLRMPKSAGTHCQRRPVFCNAATKIKFSTQKQVEFGEEARIVGNIPELGSWDVFRAPKMRWNDGHVWSLELDLPTDGEIEFKCVRVAGDNTEWESAPNRSLKISGASPLDVEFEWSKEGLSGGDVGNGVPKPGKTSVVAPSAAADRHTQNGARAHHQDPDEERPAHLMWKGKETQFMTSNDHSRDRHGKWDLNGLEGPSREIVAGDEHAGSWLGKMQVVKRVLVDQVGKVADREALANAFIYLQWINSGAIECKEGGGHFRPNKHAELSREIFKSMERTIDHGGPDEVLRLLARKVQTKLPSFTEAYTQSTPLTRIRDIAHRNDIPHDLKREIKHTIQNKLHRNAGPEDLVATEAMLKRITSEGSYNENFVAEFRIFRDELREFFNAATFTSMLEGVRPSLEDADIEVLNKFLAAKGKADQAGSTWDSLGPIVEALHTLTTLRACLLARLSSGLRNDASDASLAMRQRFRLSEIRAEDLVFVLLSRVVNILSQEGDNILVNADDNRWNLPIGTIILSVRHLGLNGWQQAECMAIENELGTWQQAGKLSERDGALRLKATLERLHRVTQEYTDTVLANFADRAERLGSALGIQPEIVQVFAEADIRASPIFQVSKLCLLLLKAARMNSDTAGWDVLVSGSTSGTLVEVESIDLAALQGLKQPSILLVKSATGDEEIAGYGDVIQAVILKQSVPHLSHLGIRARQEGVVFVTCEDDDFLQSELSKVSGSRIQLSASPSRVQLADASDTGLSKGTHKKKNKPGGKPVPKVQRKLGLVPLDQATVETCGAKAAFCNKLLQLSARGGFHTPASFCLPFGNMENALEVAGKLGQVQSLLQELDNPATKDQRLQEVSSALIDVIQTYAIWPVRSTYDDLVEDADMIIARSSANVEDLAGMSAAGLYDSIGGIATRNTSNFQMAVAKVWASLYTLRAILARRAAGVKQQEAAMSVLVQEQLHPDYSFVLHTKDPVDDKADNIYVEMAPGLGETLASGVRGSPWRFAIDKKSGRATTLSFANFSRALHARLPQGSRAAGNTGVEPQDKLYHELTKDYSKDMLSSNADAMTAFAKKLRDVGVYLEKEFGSPQDIEGALVGDKVFVVQSRPQM